MITSELSINIKIENKEKLSSIMNNITSLAGLAKNEPGAGNIASLIIKDLNGLFVPAIKPPRDNPNKNKSKFGNSPPEFRCMQQVSQIACNMFECPNHDNIGQDRECMLKKIFIVNGECEWYSLYVKNKEQ